MWEMAESVSELLPAHFSHTSALLNTVSTSLELWIPRLILPFTACISPPLYASLLATFADPSPYLAFMGRVRKSWLLVALQPVGLQKPTETHVGRVRQVGTESHDVKPLRNDTSAKLKSPKREFISQCHLCDESTFFSAEWARFEAVVKTCLISMLTSKENEQNISF